MVDRKNEMDGIDESKDDRWERYLNWSTEDNPDGVGIVHDAMDQVSSNRCLFLFMPALFVPAALFYFFYLGLINWMTDFVNEFEFILQGLW